MIPDDKDEDQFEFDRDDPDAEELEMLWDKGEEIVNKAKDLMSGLKAKIAFTMAQKKG